MNRIFWKKIPFYGKHMVAPALKRTPVTLGIRSLLSLLWMVLNVVLSLMSGLLGDGTVTIFQVLTQRFSSDTAELVITAANF